MMTACPWRGVGGHGSGPPVPRRLCGAILPVDVGVRVAHLDAHDARFRQQDGCLVGARCEALTASPEISWGCLDVKEGSAR